MTTKILKEIRPDIDLTYRNESHDRKQMSDTRIGLLRMPVINFPRISVKRSDTEAINLLLQQSPYSQGKEKSPDMDSPIAPQDYHKLREEVT